MRNEFYEEITGSLVRTYGPFQVYRLMQMAGRDLDIIAETDKHHLIVLVDDHDEVVEAIWHYDTRVDLPWIVYAIKRHLSILESIAARIVDEQAQFTDLIHQPEYMARWQEWFDVMMLEGRVSSESSPNRAAERLLANSESRLDRLRFEYDKIATPLRDLEAAHPEGIADVSNLANAKHEQQMRRIEEGRRKAEAWRTHVGKGITNWSSIMGPHVMQAGPFHVYQNLGDFDRVGLLPGGSRAGWVNPSYMILFEDDTLGAFDIGPFAYHYVPSPLQVCRPARSWFAQLNYSIDAATKALSESSDPDEVRRIHESLAWSKKLYLRVYNAWVALDCPDAPTDNPDPVFDPTTSAVFSANRSDPEETQ